MKRRALREIIIDGNVATLVLVKKQREFHGLVDAADVPLIQDCRCICVTGGAYPDGKFYIRVVTGDGREIPLHRLLLCLSKDDALVGDHKNGNTLDNRRGNLRAVHHSINLLNRPTSGRSDLIAGLRGIKPVEGKYDAELAGVYLGRFADIRDAVETIWLSLLMIDPHSAQRYLRELPESAPDQYNSPLLEVAQGAPVMPVPAPEITL